jgi:type IV pilus assembly protein PilA
MKKEVTNNKGFSLVELIVVIAIMAVLMAVLAPALLRYVEKSRKQTDESSAAEITNAVEIALSDDTIYDEVAGSTTITVTYDGKTGSLTPAGIDVSAVTSAEDDFMAEIGTTLKASEDSGSYSIAAAKSKTHKEDTFTVTAEFDSTKSCYVVEGKWASEDSSSSGSST